MTLGPSIADVQEDLIASNDDAATDVYEYVIEDGRIYAVGPFWKARIGITIELIAGNGDDRG